MVNNPVPLFYRRDDDVGLENNRVARIIFCVRDGTMVLLHGFIKKTQKTPLGDLALADKRNRDVEKADEKGKA